MHGPPSSRNIVHSTYVSKNTFIQMKVFSILLLEFFLSSYYNFFYCLIEFFCICEYCDYFPIPVRKHEMIGPTSTRNIMYSTYVSKVFSIDLLKFFLSSYLCFFYRLIKVFFSCPIEVFSITLIKKILLPH